jgi:hypothetical protein
MSKSFLFPFFNQFQSQLLSRLLLLILVLNFFQQRFSFLNSFRKWQVWKLFKGGIDRSKEYRILDIDFVSLYFFHNLIDLGLIMLIRSCLNELRNVVSLTRSLPTRVDISTSKATTSETLKLIMRIILHIRFSKIITLKFL